MAAPTGPEAGVSFTELHEHVLALVEAGHGPLLLANGASGVEIDALAADEEMGLSATIRMATFALREGTASLAVVEEGSHGRPIATEGTFGRVFHAPGDDTPLIPYLAKRTARSTLSKELSTALMEELAAHIGRAVGSLK